MQTSLVGILIMHILNYIREERNINNFYLDFILIKQKQMIEKYKLNIKYINIIGSYNHSKIEAKFLKYIIYYKQNWEVEYYDYKCKEIKNKPSYYIYKMLYNWIQDFGDNLGCNVNI